MDAVSIHVVIDMRMAVLAGIEVSVAIGSKVATTANAAKVVAAVITVAANVAVTRIGASVR